MLKQQGGDLELRWRFRDRLLTRCTEGEIHHARHDQELVPDEDLLRILIDARIERGDDEGTFRDRYDQARANVLGAPSFDDLVGKGWFRVTWGRVLTERGQVDMLKQASIPELQPLEACLRDRFRGRVIFSNSLRNDPRLAALVTRIESGALDLHNLGAIRAVWVSLRLWEVAPYSDPSANLRWWHDRWVLLGEPSLLIHRDWGEADAAQFRGAALATLEIHAQTNGWAAYRDRLVEYIAASGGDIAYARERVSAPPDGPIARLGWLSRDVAFDEARFDQQFYGLVRLLLDEAADDGFSQEGRLTADQVLNLAFMAPELFGSVRWHLERRPVLIAEAIIKPEWTPLACALIADQRKLQQERRPHLDDHDGEALKALFAEAVDVMLDALGGDTVRSDEVADLLVMLRRPPRGRFNTTEVSPAYEVLLGKVSQLRPEAAGPLAKHLLTRAEPGSLDDENFAALLDLAARVDVVDEIDVGAVVAFYVDAITNGQITSQAWRLDGAACRALFDFATASGRKDEKKFLRPIEVETTLRAAVDEREIGVQFAVAKGLRAHIRVLSRIISTGVDEEGHVIDALSDSIMSGARLEEKSGHVTAFGPAFESGPMTPMTTTPLADDIAAAIAAANAAGRVQIVEAFSQTSEPYILAQLISRVAGQERERLQEMVSALSPQGAAETRWPEDDQARVRALLDAELTDLASQFSDHSQSTLSAAGQQRHRLARFQTEVRVAYQKGDSQTLDRLVLPDNLRPFELEDAQYTLDFFRALHLLEQPGQAGRAGDALELLLVKRPHSQALLINAHAARVAALMRGNIFQKLTGDAARSAAALIDQGKALLARTNVEDSDAVIGNMAMLQLAVDDPSAAIAAIENVPTARRSPEATAYMAVATERLSGLSAGLGVLANSPWTSANTPPRVIVAAKEHMEQRRAFDATPTVVTAVDRAKDIKSALDELRGLDPLQQARAHGHPGLHGYLREHVWLATTALQGMAPALGKLSDDLDEDSFNFVLRQLIHGRMHAVGWQVGDQSKSGFADKRPGERDLDVKWNSVDLSIIEGVIWRQDTESLRKHFIKLFAYGECVIYFYVAYVEKGNRFALQQTLEAIAKEDAPPSLTYRDAQIAPPYGSDPINFVARYDAERGPVEVHFFIVDIARSAMREAAALARTPKTSTGGTAKTTSGQCSSS